MPWMMRKWTGRNVDGLAGRIHGVKNMSENKEIKEIEEIEEIEERKSSEESRENTGDKCPPP